MHGRAGMLIAVLGIGALVTAGCGPPSEPTPEQGAAPAAASPPGDPGATARLGPLAEAVRRNPDDPEALHALAFALHQAGRRDEALEQFRRLVMLTPAPVHLIELGVAYASVSRFDEARVAFERALEAEPGNPITLHHLGNLARRRGELTEAISLLGQAVENDADYLMALFHLAETEQEAGRLPDAYRSYEKVVKLEPRDATELQAFDAALLQLARLDVQMGETERAIGFLRAVVQSAPEHPSAHLLLSQALAKQGHEEEARRELEVHRSLVARSGPATAQTP